MNNSVGFTRYAIAWRWKDSERWQLWFSSDKESGTSYNVATFQWYSDTTHRLTNALDYMNEHVKRHDIECKIVDLEYKVYDLDFTPNGGIVRGKEM